MRFNGGIICNTKCGGRYYNPGEVKPYGNIQEAPYHQVLAGMSPEQRKRTEHKRAYLNEQRKREVAIQRGQLKTWEDSLIAREIAEHGLSDYWREKLNEYATPTAACMIEGGIELFRRNGQLPETGADWLRQLPSVGFQLSKTTVYNTLSSDETKDLFPKCSSRYPKDTTGQELRYLDFIKSILSGIVQRAWARRYEKLVQASGGFWHPTVLKNEIMAHFGNCDLPPIDHDVEALKAANKVAGHMRSQLRKSTGAGTSTPLRKDWIVVKPTDYRRLYVRSRFDYEGEKPQDTWARMAGVERHSVKRVLAGAGIQTKQRLVSEIVDSKREAFDVAKRNGARLVEVHRHGVHMPFHAAMRIESGDTVVIAPVSEHKVFSDKPPSERRKSAGGRAGPAIKRAPDNMRQPGNWFGRKLDPQAVYWQMIRLLCKHFGWRVDLDRRLLIHKASGCVYTNPSKDVLRSIVTAGFEPYDEGAHDGHLAQLAAFQRGTLFDHWPAGHARTKTGANRRKSPFIFLVDESALRAAWRRAAERLKTG